MQKFFCAGFSLLIFIILQDCLVPAEGVRIRVVKVKRQPDAHYTKRQASRSSYTDVPLTGDPDPEAESFRVNTNNLRPEDNPYNAGNRHIDYPTNNNNNNNGQYNHNNNNNNRYNNNNNQNNNNHRRYEEEHRNNNNDYPGQHDNYHENNRNSGNNQQRFQNQQNQPDVNDDGPYNQRQQQDNTDAIRPRPVRKEGDKDGDCPGCGHNIPGDAGVDYPNYHTPPKTTFTCSKQSYSGYYADVEARCQVFWICQKNRADAFLCPNGTIFNQQVFVCDWWFNSDCNTAPDYYSRNQYLYAGPTVDLFGNPITPHNSNNNPFTGNNANNRNPTQPIRRTAPAETERLAAQQPQQSLPPPQQQRSQSVPQQSQVQRIVPQQQQQSQVQRVVPQNTGYNNNNNNNRRNDFTPTTSLPPIVHHQQQQQNNVQGGYSKRSQQSFSPAQNKLDYHHDDRLKQPFNYPVPDNSLAAVDGEFGVKMNHNNNYERHHQPQTYHPSHRQSTYPGHTGSHSGDYAAEKYVDKHQNRHPGGYSDSQVGYTNKQETVKLTQRQYQPVTPSSPPSSSSSSSAPSKSGSINAVALQGVGYGMKTSANVKRNPFIDSLVVDQNGNNRFSSRADAPASTTTKRNAIDYDTENTTPYASSFDEELLATLTTPRYGEVISKPSIYSTEIENSQSQETTTAIPLTFGEKLTRAARKRNTSRWGNWRTMFV